MTDRLGKLPAANRLLLFVGLVLTPISFWFPRDSPLYGGGGASLGLPMLIVAVWSTCKWSDALLSLLAGVTCILGGVWYNHDRHTGFVLSMVGVGLFVLAVLNYAYARLRGPAHL